MGMRIFSGPTSLAQTNDTETLSRSHTPVARVPSVMWIGVLSDDRKVDEFDGFHTPGPPRKENKGQPPKKRNERSTLRNIEHGNSGRSRLQIDDAVKEFYTRRTDVLGDIGGSASYWEYMMRVSKWVFLSCLSLAAVGCASDDDGDGFSDKDCDDNNATVNPDADEVCDGIDNNCDGRVDEGLILEYYADLDGDGYGDALTTVSACTLPDGYVKVAGDCNDASSAIHPGQEDVCGDDIDYNCDGSTGFDDLDGDGVAACEDCDDTDSEVGSTSLFTFDADGDGYGGVGNPTESACFPSAGYTDNTDDCDDLDATINPDMVETCNTKDDDCDGDIDEDVTTVFYRDEDGDGHGTPDEQVEACEVSEGFAATADDCDDTLAEVNPGAEEICDDGLDNNCDGEGGECSLDPEAADVVMWGVAGGDEAGISVSGGGDLNADGYDDIVVGAKEESTAALSAGAAYVVYGGPTMMEEMSLETADIILTGQNPADKAGRVVRIVDDVNADGGADLVVAAPSADPTGSASGKVYINFGGGTSGSLGDYDVMFRGRNGYNYAGLGLGHGDFNGDDDGDVLIGAPGADEGGPNHGTVYLLPGPIAAGAINAATVNSYITGEDPNDGIGAALGTIDHNADGVDDFIIGAPDNSEGGTDAGSVYVVFGPIDGVMSLAMADLQYTGESASDKLGTSVSSAGDIDGDGLDDIIAGATLDDGAATNAGAAYVVAGGGTMDGTIDEYAFVKLTGEASEDQFGAHVVGNGDIDDDGMDDLMVSAPLAGGTYDTGTVYVFYGSLAGTISAAEAGARFDGSILGDQLGNSLAFAGDVDGDGNTAILIGASKKDTTDVDAGGVYLMNSIGL